MNEAMRRSVRPLVIAFWLGLAFAVLYVLTLPTNHTEAEDAFNYAWQVEEASLPDLLHRHHLLYAPIMRMLYNACRLFVPELRAYPLLVGVSLLSGVLTIAFLFLLLRTRFGFAPDVSFLAAALPGVTYGFWRYSCEAEIYIPATMLVLLSLLLASRERSGLTAAVAAGLVGGVAALFHIFAVIPVIVSIPLFVLLRRGARHAAAYFFPAGGLMAIFYALAAFGTGMGLLSGRTRGDMLTPASLLQPSTLLKGGIGLGQSMFSGNYFFGLRPFREFMLRVFPFRMLDEEVFLGLEAGPWVTLIPVLVLAAFFVTLAMVVDERVRRKPDPETEPPAADAHARTHMAMALWPWLGLHVLILLATEPGNPEGWITTLLAAWLLGLLLWSGRLRNPPVQAVGALTVLLLIHNYLGGMLLLRNGDWDYNALKMRWVVDHTRPADVILTGDTPVFSRQLRYFTDATVINVWNEELSRVRERLHVDAAMTGHTLAFGDVFNPPKSMEARYPDHSRAIAAALRPYESRFTRIHDDAFGGVLMLRRAPRSLVQPSAATP